MPAELVVDGGGPPAMPTFTATSDRLTIRLAEGATVAVARRSGRCSVRLGFGRSGVGLDVSVQPGAVGVVVDQHARLAGTDPARWRSEIVAALVGWEPSLAWCPIEAGQLPAAVGALTHPLLAPLYATGGTPFGDLPRWASPLLQERDAATAAARLCPGATRRLTRSLAASLVPVDGLIDLAPLGLATAASGLVDVDRLANLLDAGTSSTGAVRRTVPSVDDVKAIRRGLGPYPVERRAALLISGLADPVRLAASLVRLMWIEHRAPRPLPVRLDELVELCERLVPVIAPARPSGPALVPPPAWADPNTAIPEATATDLLAPPGRRRGDRALTAPASPIRHADRWNVPAALLAINGRQHGGITFVVPTSSAELSQWGRILRNCLGGFAGSAASHRSWLIGLRRDEDLIGCVEVCPRTRRLRQALGPRNRPLPPPLYATALTALTAAGIVTGR